MERGRVILSCRSLAPVALALAACGDRAATTDGAVTVRDSAGVQIVEHGPLPDRTAFQIGDLLYRVGWSGDDHDFQRIWGGVLLDDGSAVAGDIGAGELVFLSPTGEVVSVLGGQGEGPTEIGGLTSINHVSGDTVVAEDDGNRRLSLFHSGGFVRSYRETSGPASFWLWAIGVVDRGLVMTTSTWQPDIPEPWVRAPIVHHPVGSERWDTLLVYDFAPSFTPGETVSPFQGSGAAAVTGDDILIARGDRAEVKRFDSRGRLTQIVRWEGRSRELNDSLWSIYAEYRRSRNTSRSEEEMRKELADAREAVTGPLPYVGTIHGDADGNAWLAEYAMDYRYPSTFRVFDRDGRWLGWVRMPPRFEILDIGRDRILGIQRDPLEVEAVAVIPTRR